MTDFISDFSFWGMLRYSIILVYVFLPILVWGYFFSYLENTTFRSWRFLDGIIGGFFSVGLLFLAKSYGDGLLPLSLVKETPLASFPLLISIIVFILFLLLLGFFFPIFRTSHRKHFWRTYFLRIVPIVLFAGFLFFLFAILTKNMFDIPLRSLPNLPEGIFTIASLVLYYVISSWQEEIVKHTFSLGDMFRPRPTFRSVFFPAFHVALGFGFLENMLYMTQFAKQVSVFSMTFLLSTWARSVFSILIHVVCSIILAFAFLRAFSRIEKPMTYGRVYLVGFIAAILVHASYNLSLAFQAQYLLIFYLIGGYLYITHAFHRQDSQVPFDSFLRTSTTKQDLV